MEPAGTIATQSPLIAAGGPAACLAQRNWWVKVSHFLRLRQDTRSRHRGQTVPGGPQWGWLHVSMQHLQSGMAGGDISVPKKSRTPGLIPSPNPKATRQGPMARSGPRVSFLWPGPVRTDRGRRGRGQGLTCVQPKTSERARGHTCGRAVVWQVPRGWHLAGER